jgi:3-phosphoshikimate 1-carboxyvinyltransferase
MYVFDEIMGSLSVEFNSNNGKLPFDMKGPLKPVSMEIDGSLSSQFVTGIIFGYVVSPYLRNEVLTIRNPASIPYIELTLDVLSSFGVDLDLVENKISFKGPYELKEADIIIEGDWSSASFFLVAGALLGDVTLGGLNTNSKQADIRILDAIRSFGAGLEIQGETIRVFKKDRNAFHFDATHCPDLFPPLAVLASFGSGESRIKGVSRLIHKESNRAESIQSELKKMGANISVVGDEMVVQGIQKVYGARIDPHGDHRIAMAASVMGLAAIGRTLIIKPDVVNKSFPDFFEYLNKLN